MRSKTGLVRHTSGGTKAPPIYPSDLGALEPGLSVADPLFPVGRVEWRAAHVVT